MAVPVQLNKLVLGKDKDSAREYLQLLQEYRAIDVCNTLLAAVKSEQLSPLVFAVFLRVTKSIECISICLRQEFSIIIRKVAIAQYGKALKDVKRWKEAWHHLGDVGGILKYLSTISVNEVQLFCRVVGQCNYGQTRSHERSDAIEKLLKAMNPSLFPNQNVKTPDKRPLGLCASGMVSACSVDFVQSLITEDIKNPIYTACSKGQLIKAFKNIAYDYTKSIIFTIKIPAFPQDVRLFLSEFVRNEPNMPGKEKHFSASMEFSEKLLEGRIRNLDSTWPHQPAESQVYLGLLKRCIKKKVTKKRLHEVIDLGLRLIKSKPKQKDQFSDRGVEFWGLIVRYWTKWPEYWEDLLITGLKLGLAGSGGLPNDFKTFINSIEIEPDNTRPDRIWSALKLFCFHVPKTGVDIDTAETLEPLAKLDWDISIFRQLPEDKAIRVLKLLLRTNTKSDFLLCYELDSILKVSSMQGQRNFNALLYLTQLQVDSLDDFQRLEGLERATEAYTDYKNKCMMSKEQQDRAQYAKAMGLFAIASGSLGLYGDYVTWLARFIRDPLTVKVVFRRDAIAAKEVSDLLSAIPNRITESTNLLDISESVSKANEILLNFHEHHKTAKREPSYQSYDWSSVSELIAASIRKRIDQADELQKHLNTSQGELYSQIWSHTFSVYSQSGADSMEKACVSMSSLLTSLPPKLLVNVTKSMLEIDNKYRATKAEGKEAEDESNVIGQLVHDCLLALAGGDDSTLAGELIIHFIIDRPDASSWHRQMLRPGFFKTLPAKYAQQLLLNFSKIIGEKLEEQSYVRVREAANTPAVIKVTTVKYLAQILQDAEFLSAESSIDVLLELFKVATHPDIRLATLESMLSALDKLVASDLHGSITDIPKTQNPLIQKILAALDTVVPVIGSINERRPPTEQEWDDSLLPVPSFDRDARPLWKKLVKTAKHNKSLKDCFVQRLLFPGLEISVLMHRKWLALFLKKYTAGFSIDQLPATIPANPLMMTQINEHFLQYVPKKLFGGWIEFTKFLLERPACLDIFISKLKSDEKINNKPDVLHFLSLFGHSTHGALNLGVYRLVSIIHHTWQPSLLPNGAGVSVSQVQEAILDQMGVVLLRYDENVTQWSTFLSQLRHPTSTLEDWQRWRQNCRPLLERVVAMVNGLRTPRWSADPNRQPSVLPTTIRPKLWMLDFPIVKAPTEMANAQIAMCGQQLVDLLSGLLNGETGLIKSEKLIADVMTISEKINDRGKIQIGHILGTFTRVDAFEEIMRVSLAIKFFENGRQALKDKSLKVAVADALQRWQKSSVEDVREILLNLKNEQMSNSLWHAAFSKD